MTDAARMLSLAARLALRGQGDVEPNPLVGCVIARGGDVLGVGHHRRFGHAHAERDALDSCARLGHDPAGATVYCTLEPCACAGRQPACVDALINARVARVVFAREDPTPGKGGGAARLREAGIVAERFDACPLATSVSAPFIKRATTDLPWVFAKWAQTIDGRVATRAGESQWISGPRARARVHRLRARVDAILTGIGTVLADDPLLTARDAARVRRRAARVVADSDLDIPLESRLVRTADQQPTIIACAAELARAEITRAKRERLAGAGVSILGVPTHASGRGIDLRFLLAVLRARGCSSVLVEAGPGLMGAMIEEDMVDEAVVHVAPLLLGDELARSAAAGRVVERLSGGKRFSLYRVKSLNADVELVYRATGAANASHTKEPR